MAARIISHYEILERLGEGGMGVVYKARDSHLERTVAIKVLSEGRVADLERQRRFVQEARAASALKHPNIVTVHDIDESEGEHFIVMECIEGESLDRLLQRRPLRLHEALDYGVQIADALAAAHAAGIIHRDLKPGNVMIGGKGRVKLVDFGLAKLLEPPPTADQGVTHTLIQLTEEGAVLGTTAYMSPEQAEGGTTDARSDIFSFGAMLYEMLTRRRAFEGTTQRSTLTAVITKDPPAASTMDPSVPGAVDHVVQRCLAKDPDRRWQSAADLCDELRWLEEFLRPGGAAGQTVRKVPIPWWALVGVLAFAIVLILIASAARAPGPAGQLPVRRFELAAEQRPVSVAISPNGRHVAYRVGPEGRSSLWVRDLDRDEPRQVVGIGSGVAQFWSPDSQWIGFVADTFLQRVSLHGGDSVKLCKLPSELIGGGTWNLDGQSLVISCGTPTRLYEVPVQGGSPRLLVTAEEAESKQYFVDPYFPPGDTGRRILLFSVGGMSRPYEIIALDLATGKRSRLGPGRRAVYSPSGHLVYEHRQQLWARPFSLATLAVTGPPVPIEDNGVSPGVSADGTLVFLDGRTSGPERLIWKDRNGRSGGVIGQPQERIYTPKLSPDGTRVAVWGRENDNDDIWIHDTTRGLKVRITSNASAEDRPIWFPDGRRLAFASNRNGNTQIFVQDVNGTGEAQELAPGKEARFPEHWSRDGKFLICDFIGERRRDIWYLRRRDDDAKYEALQFVVTDFDEGEPNFSPDGRFVAYSSDESGRREVYVRGFPHAGSKTQVSTSGGTQPRWNGDGRELFYVEGETIMAVPFNTASPPEPGKPQRLFEHPGIARRPEQQYDVSADGSRFVVIEPVGGPDRLSIRVVQNWFAAFHEKEAAR